MAQSAQLAIARKLINKSRKVKPVAASGSASFQRKGIDPPPVFCYLAFSGGAAT
jgi:hypothetical protein